jgi:hypothetical protein
MNDMERRLRAVEDRLAILDLEAAYAVAWDFGRAQQWAEVFAGDGCFEMLATGNTPHVRVTGHAELRGFCEQIAKDWSGLHYMHPPQLEIRGDEASSIIFFEFRHVMQGADGHIRQGNTCGHYHTRYVRTPAGWRMQSRVEKAVFENVNNSYSM